MSRQGLSLADAAVSLPAEEALASGKGLWERACAAVVAWRERKAAAMIYAVLSKLPEAELERRGIPRGELGRLLAEMRRA